MSIYICVCVVCVCGVCVWCVYKIYVKACARLKELDYFARLCDVILMTQGHTWLIEFSTILKIWVNRQNFRDIFCDFSCLSSYSTGGSAWQSWQGVGGKLGT